MKDYIVVDAEIIDSEVYAEFSEKTPAVVAANGGQPQRGRDCVEGAVRRRQRGDPNASVASRR